MKKGLHTGRLLWHYRCPGNSHHKRRRNKWNAPASAGDYGLNTKHAATLPNESSLRNPPMPSLWLLLLSLCALFPAMAAMALLFASVFNSIMSTAIPFMAKLVEGLDDPYYSSGRRSPLDNLWGNILRGIRPGLCPSPGPGMLDAIFDRFATGIVQLGQFLLLSLAEDMVDNMCWGRVGQYHNVRPTPLRPFHKLYHVFLFGILPLFAFSSENIQTTPSKVAERSMKEMHRELFNKKAFGIDNNGRPLPGHKQSSSSKMLTEEKWAKIVHIVSNWKSTEEEQTLSAQEREESVALKKTNKVGYHWIKDFHVSEGVLANGITVKRLHRIESYQGQSWMLEWLQLQWELCKKSLQ